MTANDIDDLYDRFELFAAGVRALCSMQPDDTGYLCIKGYLDRDADDLLDVVDKLLWTAKLQKRRHKVRRHPAQESPCKTWADARLPSGRSGCLNAQDPHR